MKRLFILIALVATMCNVHAQKQQMKYSIETAFGTEWQVGARIEHKCSEYLAWDVLTARFAVDYRHERYSSTREECTLTTGLRGYLPNIIPGSKLFLGVGVGYGTIFHFSTNAWGTNNFVTDVATGVSIKGRYGLGYGMSNFWFKGSNYKNHVMRFSYTF